MTGLIEEASGMMKEDADPEVMDAVLIAAAQKVEHYEIATYGTLCTWADILGYKKAKTPLVKTLVKKRQPIRSFPNSVRKSIKRHRLDRLPQRSRG
jgi:ferritin-like metal-binding protein YciE